MFNDCKSLKVLDISNFDTRSIKMGEDGILGDENMFKGCKSLKRIALGKKTKLKHAVIPGGAWTRTKLLNGKKSPNKNKVKLMKDYTGKYPGWYTR